MRKDANHSTGTSRLAAHVASLLRGDRGRQRGQSIVEVAIIFPVAMLMLAGALDMGRLFYARVSIENAAREGAVFAARNPGCDTAVRTECDDPNTADWHIRSEFSSLQGLVTSFSCMDGGTPRASVEDCQAGDSYVVTVQDQFDFITPVLEPILGSSISLQASASAPVLNGAFDTSAAFATFAPDDPGATPTATPSGSPSSSPTATPPGAYCSVANLVGVTKNDAGSTWLSAGLYGSVIDGGGNGNYTIGWQSLAPGTLELCTSSITISQSAPETTPTPTPSPTPTPTPTPSPTPTPTPSPTPTPTPTPSPTPSPTASPTPTPSCTVPEYFNVRVNKAEGQWFAAGFSGDFDRVGGGNFKVQYQDLAPGSAPCSSDITVYKVAP